MVREASKRGTACHGAAPMGSDRSFVCAAALSACGAGALVLLPCHKSHVDYLLLSYLLYEYDIHVPLIAAGDNLSFPIVGPFFRRCAGGSAAQCAPCTRHRGTVGISATRYDAALGPNG